MIGGAIGEMAGGTIGQMRAGQIGGISVALEHKGTFSPPTQAHSQSA